MAEIGVHSEGNPPSSPPPELDSIFGQGMAFHRAGLLSEAEQFYREVLRVDPRHFDSLHLLGVIAYQRGQYADAIRQIDVALKIKPDVADAYNNRGNALKKLGQFVEALASYNQAIALKPDDAASFNNRGSVFKDLKQFEKAVADFDSAVALKPDFTEAFNNRGNVLFELKRFEEALANYDRAIALKPDNADAFNNRGNALKDLKRFDEALASYDRACEFKPDYARAFYNRGTLLFEFRRLEDSLADLNKAIKLDPNHPEAFHNRGSVLKELKRIDEAIADLDQAISLKPDYADALWSRALCKLLLGRYQDGWTEYEWRWQTVQIMVHRRAFRQRQWGGKSDISGKTILLHSEQGYGDVIMAARYISRVAAAGARVILDVPIAVVPLLAPLAGVAQVVSKGQILPSFDTHCPMMSLPAAFGTTLETIPAEVPYLSAPSPYVEKWSHRLPKSGAPRIGISWAGNPQFKHDDERSIGLRRLLPLLSRREVQFFSIQKDLRDGDVDILRANRQITQLGDAIDSFADTAAIISSLDLVISSDTAVVHLAGALGKPVWILLQFVPDWRWLLDRDDSPWYPTARLFRQSERNNWSSVISNVDRALDGWLKN
jgi:tetratricopeptide (TPR) repeat protein